MSELKCSDSCSNLSIVQCECQKSFLLCEIHFLSHFLNCSSFFRIVDTQKRDKRISKSSIKAQLEIFISILFNVIQEIMTNHNKSTLNSFITDENLDLSINMRMMIETQKSLRMILKDLNKIMQRFTFSISQDLNNIIEIPKESNKLSKKIVIDVITIFFDKLCYLHQVINQAKEKIETEDQFEELCKLLIYRFRYFLKLYLKIFEFTDILYSPRWIFYSIISDPLNTDDRLVQSYGTENNKELIIDPKPVDYQAESDKKKNSPELSKASESYQSSFYDSKNSLDSPSVLLKPEEISQNLLPESLQTTPSLSISSDSPGISKKSTSESPTKNESSRFLEKSKISDNEKCLKCFTPKPLKTFPCSHRYCLQCISEEKCPKCSNQAGCDICRNPETLKQCDTCQTHFCDACITIHANTHTCDYCKSINSNLCTLKCGHRYCDSCLNDSKFCKDPNCVESQCKVCAAPHYKKIVFSECGHKGCKKCQIYDHCFDCITKMTLIELKNKFGIKGVMNSCKQCKRSKTIYSTTICGCFICTDCFKKSRNFDFFCKDCYLKKSENYCVDCRIRYDICKVENYQKPCCRINMSWYQKIFSWTT